VETGPDLRYDYPPMLEALVQLGFLSEYDKGIFKCVCDPQLRKKAFSLGAPATQALHRGLEDIFFKMLVLQGELFECLKVDTYERYWDNVRENFLHRHNSLVLHGEKLRWMLCPQGLLPR
jgi:hypothetical protein